MPKIPQGGEGVSVTLDGGDSYSWDLLSRPLSAGRSLPDQQVTTPSWDLGGRPLEEVVGDSQPPFVTTVTHTFQRDSFGRPTRQSSSDGSVLETRYNRAGDAIAWATGAGTSWGVSLDSLGRVVREIRPSGRGETRYGYDLDGRLLAEERVFSGGVWRTENAYDGSGRLAGVTHADGSGESWTYRPDDQPATWTTRDGVLVTYSYDAANRLLSQVPAIPEGGEGVSVTLDGGDSYSWDLLSRPLSASRSLADQQVATPSWDLGGRPLEEVVGDRPPLSRSFDLFDNPRTTSLPGGRVHAAGSVAGWQRRFDTLDRVEQLTSLGGGARAAGATWLWGGGDRLYAQTTEGPLGTRARFGYYGATDGPTPTAGPASAWHLGAVEWGAASGEVWGGFGVGWRPTDGTKLNRPSSGSRFASMGWGYGYDGGVRLRSAASAIDRWEYDYGAGDEKLLTRRREAGELDAFATGPDGRIAARDGVTYGYDRSGRRTEDERFTYSWSWRGERDVSPYAGHQIRYTYDALGRLLHREHRGQVPAGGGERPFIELREYVWDGWSLATEVAYGSPDKTQPRWRKTYVPGPGGLDDAVQVLVEVEPTYPGPYAGETRLYSYLRDEMGTVVGLVAEDEPGTAERPQIPVRYLYTPYGEAHAETGPELRRARFAADVDSANGIPQTIADERLAAPGALVTEWSLPLDEATLADNITVEQLVPGVGWEALLDVELAVEEGGEGEAPRLIALPPDGWPRGASYRVRLGPALQDLLGRPFGRSESLEWVVLPAPAEGDPPPVVFDKKYPFVFETFDAARETDGGRFPGGQSALFQGLWTDPVTGVSYARARWYDPRSAVFLAEDSNVDIDSANLYAFVGWSPAMAMDPLGLESIRQWWDIENDLVDRPVWGATKWFGYQAWNIVTFGFLAEHDEVYETTQGGEYALRATLAVGKAGAKLYLTVQTAGAGAAFGEAAGLGTLSTGMVTGGAIGGGLTGAEHLFALAEGRPTPTLGDYALNIGAGAAIAGLSSYGAELRAQASSTSASGGAPRINLVSPRPSRPIAEIPDAWQGGRRVYKIPPGSSGGGSAYKAVSPEVRARFFPPGQPEPVCSYCRTRPANPVDHVHARSRGGNLEPENTTPGCTHCNPSKQARVAPKNPPPEYQGDVWPPLWWPQRMRVWWEQTYGR